MTIWSWLDLHLGEQGDDVLGVGHKVRRAHVARNLLAPATVINDGRDEVLDVGYAHDAVDVAAIDGNAAIPRCGA
jgi:hypothetical protein